MMATNASARLGVRPGLRGDTGQGTGGTQKSGKRVHSHSGRGKMVRPPGFEPGSKAWKASIITPRLWPQSLEHVLLRLGFKSIAEVNGTRQVSGRVESWKPWQESDSL